MKLEVGNYVRTKNGMIAKIIDKRDVSGSLHREEIVFILDNRNKLALHSKKVSKASFNITDLIEEGDYVNGLLVMSNDYNFDKPIKIFSNLRFGKDDIKSIVTKEQFKANEYIVE